MRPVLFGLAAVPFSLLLLLMAGIDQSALGLLETRGLIAALEAADAMVKAASVSILRREQTDPALITVEILGDVAAVKAALDAGRVAAERVGTVVSVHVIARPDPELARMLLDGPARSRSTSTEVDLESMTVRELRALAREIPSLPIQGREIARARKGDLVAILRGRI